MDLGFLAKNELDPDLGNLAFNLKENTFSNVIQSTFGWRVIYLEMIKSANNLSFDKVKDDIKNEWSRPISSSSYIEDKPDLEEKDVNIKSKPYTM